MKKILFLAAGLLTLASCKEDFKDWSDAKPAEPVTVLDEAKLSVAAAAASLDLDDVKTETVALFKPSMSVGKIASEFDVTLSAGENTYGIKADADGVVKTEELNKAVVTLYDRVRELRDVNITVKATAVVEASTGDIVVPVQGSTATKIMVQSTAYNEFYYLVGGDTNWNGDFVLQSKECDGKYVGYAYLSQGFKFRPVAGDWSVSLGSPAEGKVGESGGDCPAPAVAGLHKIELDLEAMTYKITNFGVVSLIGDAVGGWDKDVDMEYSSAEGCYTVTTDLVAGSFKFRSNHDWNGVNWGGDDADKLVMDAGNCSVAEAGMYIVRFWPSYSGNGRYEIEAL